VLRAVLLLAFLPVLVLAAPRLRPEKPAPPTAEDTRIAALKAKYDELRRTGNPAQRRELALSADLVRQLATIAERSRGTEDEAGTQTALQRTLAQDPVRRDLYDILMYDRARQKAADGK
jgi:hypothetical protein